MISNGKSSLLCLKPKDSMLVTFLKPSLSLCIFQLKTSSTASLLTSFIFNLCRSHWFALVEVKKFSSLVKEMSIESNLLLIQSILQLQCHSDCANLLERRYRHICWTKERPRLLQSCTTVLQRYASYLSYKVKNLMPSQKNCLGSV